MESRCPLMGFSFDQAQLLCATDRHEKNEIVTNEIGLWQQEFLFPTTTLLCFDLLSITYSEVRVAQQE